MNTFTKIFLIFALAAVAFVVGTNVESDRGHRNACAQQGGKYNWNGATCDFSGLYDDSIRLTLSKSCPIPGKSWYLINSTETGWFHKCD